MSWGDVKDLRVPMIGVGKGGSIKCFYMYADRESKCSRIVGKQQTKEN
jgi:hypothetical protein